MIEVEHSSWIDASPEHVWEYVSDIANWAPFVIGYQRLRILDDLTSVWTLRGDVGMLAREVDIRVEITEWRPPQEVRFTVRGITERIEGAGVVRVATERREPCDEGLQDLTSARRAGRRRLGVAARIRAVRRRSLRAFLRLIGGASRTGAAGRRDPVVATQGPTPAPVVGTNGRSAGTGAGTRLGFHLSVRVGGPTAPMVELLMNPLLTPAAEDLLTHVREEVEARSGGRSGIAPAASGRGPG